MILRQRLIRPLHYFFQRNIAAQNHDRTRLRISASLHSDNHTIFYLGLPEQRRLQILRINIHSSRRDDDFFLTSFEIQIAGLIKRSNIAGAIPALEIGNFLGTVVVPISGSYAGTPRTRISPSSASFTSRPGKTFPIDPFPRRKG